MKEQYIYLAILVLLVISLSVVFFDEGLTEQGYKELNLLKKTISFPQNIEIIRSISVVLALVSGIIFFYSRKVSLISLVVSLLLVLSPLVFSTIAYVTSFMSMVVVLLLVISGFLFFYGKDSKRWAALIPLLLSTYLVYPYLDFSFSLAKIKEIGLILPLSLLTIISLFRDKINESHILFLLGIVLAPFVPAFALVFLAFSLVPKMEEFFEKPQVESWALIIFGIVLYVVLNPLTSNYTQAITASVALGIISYFLFSLFTVAGAQLIRAFIVFTLVLAVAEGFLIQEQLKTQVANKEEIELFKSAEKVSGSVGITGYPEAFEFYSNKEGVLLTSKALLSNGALGVDYAIITNKGLDRVLAPKPIVFRPLQVAQETTGYVADYISTNYILRVAMNEKFELITDAILEDLTGRSPSRTISFPKLKNIGSIDSDSFPTIMNTENILDTDLYELLFVKTPVVENKAGKVVRT